MTQDKRASVANAPVAALTTYMIESRHDALAVPELCLFTINPRNGGYLKLGRLSGNTWVSSLSVEM